MDLPQPDSSDIDLRNLSDEELAARYWNADLEGGACEKFAALEREIRSRGSHIAPWVG